MSSPFAYEQPVQPAALVGRSDELRTLADRATRGCDSRLQGPRRFGKTSLLRAALAAVRNERSVPIEVDLMGCVSASDLAERIERAYATQLDPRLRRWFDGLVRTLPPTVGAVPSHDADDRWAQLGAPGLLDRLALPRGIHERTGRVCVVAFDEFQEIARIDPALVGLVASELEAHGDAATYVLSGSDPGLMADLTGDRGHPFFARAAPVELGPLADDELAHRISAGFAEGRRNPGEALGPLLDVAEGHPQRAMLLAHHLYRQLVPKQTADIEDWVDAQTQARRAAHGETQALWRSCTELERRVLKVIAHRTVALGSHEAQARFGLAKGGSTKAAVSRLLIGGHVVQDASTRTSWRLVDPFLAAWLRDR